jgi:uncharacterized protein (DUF433 family)
MTTATINHIEIDDHGFARFAGSRIMVMHLVMEKMANGWGPEELHEQFAHLSLAQIHAAFAYYYDHKAEVDDQIHRSVEEAERMRLEAGPSSLAERLRREGKLA